MNNDGIIIRVSGGRGPLATPSYFKKFLVNQLLNNDINELKRGKFKNIEGN